VKDVAKYALTRNGVIEHAAKMNHNSPQIVLTSHQKQTSLVSFFPLFPSPVLIKSNAELFHPCSTLPIPMCRLKNAAHCFIPSFTTFDEVPSRSHLASVRLPFKSHRVAPVLQTLHSIDLKLARPYSGPYLWTDIEIHKPLSLFAH
jgi:hypothetical protein